MQEIEIKKALDEQSAAIEAAFTKYNGQLADKDKVDNELKAEIKALSDKFESTITEIAQKQDSLKNESVIITAGSEFVKSEQFKQLQSGSIQRARLEIKAAVTSTANTAFPTQVAGVIAGNVLPKTIRSILTAIPVSGNMVNAIREATWTNNAAGVLQEGAKPESTPTFEQYNVAIETIAHFTKVSNQLLADAPAIVAWIDTRLRDGLADKIESQLLNGNGTPPQLSGLTDAGNFTAYTAATGDLLVDAINRAKYALWATGNMPDTVIVNPADWGAMERTREGAGTGAYLYGAPGTIGSGNPFGVNIVLSPYMAAGNFLIGALNQSAVLYNRSGAVVELGYVNDDFTKNLVTIRAEERLGLAVTRPAGILYGDFSL